MTAPLAFIDLETISLVPKWQHIWEVGVIVERDGTSTEHQWFVTVDLAEADPFALNVGRYHQRHPNGYDYQKNPNNTDEVLSPADTALRVAKLTLGCHLVGAVISFDEKRVESLLRAHGHCPGYHYHVIDVEAMAIGYLASRTDGYDARKMIAPPWKSDELTEALGLTTSDEDKHTALGDARWAAAVYRAVMGK